jgi:hypothetical protein
MALGWHWPIIKPSAAFLDKNTWDNSASISYKWASTERQWLLPFHFEKCWGCTVTLRYNQMTSRLSSQKCLQYHRYCTLKLNVNRASTEYQRWVHRASMMYGRATCIIQWLCIDRYSESPYWPPLLGKIPATIPLPPCKNMCLERQKVLWGTVSFTVTKCLESFLNAVLNGQSI